GSVQPVRLLLPDGPSAGVGALGGEMPTFALACSRPGAQGAARYYDLLRLGRDGYRRVQQACSGHGDVAGLEDRRAGPVRASLGRQRRSRIRVPPTGRCAELHGIRCLRRAPPLRLVRASVPHAASARGCRGPAHRGAQRVQPRSGGAAARAPRARRRRAGTYGWPSRRTTRHRLPPLGGTVCRLFGMASGPEHIRATFWLLDAHDSLARQSRREPDGTGLGWYEAGTYPERLRDPEPAWRDPSFSRDAKEVRSRTFIAHVRLASVGGRTVENTHPFLMQGRMLAHNGHIGGLHELEARLGPARELVRGETDSERFFALVTAEADRLGDLEEGLVSAARWV